QIDVGTAFQLGCRLTVATPFAAIGRQREDGDLIPQHLADLDAAGLPTCAALDHIIHARGCVLFRDERRAANAVRLAQARDRRQLEAPVVEYPAPHHSAVGPFGLLHLARIAV